MHGRIPRTAGRAHAPVHDHRHALDGPEIGRIGDIQGGRDQRTDLGIRLQRGQRRQRGRKSFRHPGALGLAELGERNALSGMLRIPGDRAFRRVVAAADERLGEKRRRFAAGAGQQRVAQRGIEVEHDGIAELDALARLETGFGEEMVGQGSGSAALAWPGRIAARGRSDRAPGNQHFKTQNYQARLR